MEYRQLGKSDLKLPVVSFGAWVTGGWMWGGSDDDEAIRAIQRGIDIGITCVDTAPMYGFGRSEEVVGKAIKGRRDEVIVATKCGLRSDKKEGKPHFKTQDFEGNDVMIYGNLRPDSLRWECEQSLRRLGVDVIDLYQMHWPDPTSSLADAMDVLLDLQQQGKIRAIGVSNSSPAQMAECLGQGYFASDQPHYSLLQRGIEADVLPYCIEHNIGVLAYSPIAQGLLTGKVTPDREYNEGDQRKYKEAFKPDNVRRVLAALDKVKPIAEAHNATLAQIAIAWVTKQPGLTTAIVGARNEKQVEENAKAGDIVLTDAEEKAMRAAFEGLPGL